MRFRVLKRSEIERFREIDRREVVEEIYYHQNGSLNLVDEYCDVPPWTEEEQKEFIDHITSLNDRGGIIYGAFDDNKLVGMITLDNVFIGKDKDQLNLNGLWVSKDYRNQGVASRLLDLIIVEARQREAKALYVSATPSKNTVEFYRNNGFRLAQHLDKKLFDKEPEDIHMVLKI